MVKTKKFLLLSIVTIILVGCTTTQSEKASVSPLPSSAPVNLLAAQQICAGLKTQLQTQLPYQVQSVMHWQSFGAADPLQPTGPQYPACQIRIKTDGATILKLGLSPDFMSTTLERLNWQSTPATTAYAADGPNSHVVGLINGRELAVLGYRFAPLPNACSSNQPIAACDVPQKQWDYQMKLLVLEK